MNDKKFSNFGNVFFALLLAHTLITFRQSFKFVGQLKIPAYFDDRSLYVKTAKFWMHACYKPEGWTQEVKFFSLLETA